MKISELVTIITAAIGAAGTVLSAWIVNRVRKVQREVDGHTDKLERKISELRAALDQQTRT